MEDFTPYQAPYDALRESTVLRFKIDKLMHSLNNDQLREIVAFIGGLPEPVAMPPNYRPLGAYKAPENPYEPFTPIPDKWLKVV